MLYDVFNIVFEDMGGTAAFTEWAKGNPTEFYKLMTKIGTNAALIETIKTRQALAPVDEPMHLTSQRFLDISLRAKKLADKHPIVSDVRLKSR